MPDAEYDDVVFRQSWYESLREHGVDLADDATRTMVAEIMHGLEGCVAAAIEHGWDDNVMLSWLVHNIDTIHDLACDNAAEHAARQQPL